VLATQNPVEQEGTYPLPEAQVDRFMMKLKVGYPTQTEELEIMRRMSGSNKRAALQKVISPEKIIEARDIISDIYIDEKVERYIIDLIFASRNPAKYQIPELQHMISFGASPRASINLNRAAKAYAFLEHRGYVTPDDVRAIAMDVLRHRIILSYEAEAEDITTENVIEKLLNKIHVP